jgi:hypothetical protein
MARTSETGEGDTVGLPAVGQEGDTCEGCGSVLATDQRYCLNCGRRRGESRVDYEKRLNGGVYTPNGTAPAAATAANPQWTPAFAVLAIALLGVMLLLGVLIGKKGNNDNQTVAAQAPATTTTAAAPTTDTTATTATKTKAAKGGGAGTAPGQGDVIAGGSGQVQGNVPTAAGGSTADNAKNGPDVVSTGNGPPPAADNKAPGGGSGAGTCIGC